MTEEIRNVECGDGVRRFSEEIDGRTVRYWNAKEGNKEMRRTKNAGG